MHALVYSIGALILVALVARNPMWGILVTAAALPATQSYDSGIPILNPFNILIVSLMLGLFLRTDEARTEPNDRFPPRVSMAIFAVMVFLAWVHGSFFQKIPPAEDVRPFSRYDTFMMMKEELSLFLLMLLVFWSVRTVEEVNLGAKLVALGMSMEVLFCFLEWARKHGRITGHLQQPNSLAAFACLVSVTTAALFMATKERVRWGYFVVSVGAAFACISSHSRGGLLSLLVGALVLSLLRNRLVFVLLVVLAVSYKAWLPDVLLERIDKAYTVDDDTGDVEAADTAAQRLAIWRAGLAIMKDHPLGIGLGTYAHFSAEYGTAGELRHPDKNAHNEYMRIAAEMSPVALVVFLWFLAGLALVAWRCYTRGRDLGLGAVGYAGLAAVIGIGLPSCFGTFFFQAIISGHFWMIGGLACRGYILARRERSQALEESPMVPLNGLPARA